MGVVPRGARVEGGDRESGVCNGEEGRVEKAKAWKGDLGVQVREEVGLVGFLFNWLGRGDKTATTQGDWPCRGWFDSVGLVAVRGQARWPGGGATIVAPSSGSQ
ncbi:unnamed protein product [Sphenostylis stenocarpa]|uniref:Uncharacterized protein n=1 Tax=Sphenostylis stenocarpa TaxID=92480 RepID=A0AA87B958_9FABA|nr:unnamed protein product [Sphenostylis stenocarpa]